MSANPNNDSRDPPPRTCAPQPGPQFAAAEDKPALDRVVHDLRNFIAPIRNVAQLLRMRNPAELDGGALADMIDRQIDGIGKILLRLSELEAGSRGTGGATAQATSPAAKGPSAPAQPRRVLIADDNAALRVSLSGVFQDLGHQTQAVPDGTEALRVAREWLPEVVILDVNMPGLNGYELARLLRAEFPPSTMKLVMMSGDTLSEAAVRGARTAGFDKCVDKLAGVQAFEAILRADG
jgi:CheY-like chemotaxis protein